MNLESATLVLRTSAINTANGDINVGNFNNDCSWNINLRRCLGSMFDKYERFKICLTSTGNATPSPSLSIDNALVVINMEGLNWNNQTYNSQTGTIGTNAVLSTISTGTTAGSTTNFTGEIGCVFYKPKSDNCVIRVYLSKLSDNTIAQLQYPNLVYCFSIYGIEE